MFVWVHLYPFILQISLPKPAVFCPWAAFMIMKMTHNDIKFRKEIKMIIVVDKWKNCMIKSFDASLLISIVS